MKPAQMKCDHSVDLDNKTILQKAYRQICLLHMFDKYDRFLTMNNNIHVIPV